MSNAAPRGQPTSVLSTLNWRFSLASHRPADQGPLWVDRTACQARKSDRRVIDRVAVRQRLEVLLIETEDFGCDQQRQRLIHEKSDSRSDRRRASQEGEPSEDRITPLQDGRTQVADRRA